MTGKILCYAAFLPLVQLTAGCSQQTAAPENSAISVAVSETKEPIGDIKLIVAFGDSLFAGYGLAQHQGFAPMLEQALLADSVEARVVNAGVSGDTTVGGIQRLAFVLDGLERKPDLVIVGLGSNDMLRGLSPENARENLGAILTELKRRRIDAVLAGALSAPNMGADYADEFNAIYPTLAKEYGVPLYPFFLKGVTGRADLLLADGLHPNAQGVAEIVRRILPTIEQAVRE